MGFMVGSYNILLVILSIIIVFIASYTALDLYLRHSFSTDSFHKRWFVSGSLVLGIGIWCMQYIGIFAYIPIKDLYLDVIYVVFTLMIAVILSFFSTYLLKLKNGAILSCVAFGITICSTNFIGWGAYHGNVDITLNFPVFFITAAIGCAGIFSSLYLVKTLRSKNKSLPFIRLMGGTSFGLSLAVFRYLLRLSLNITVMNRHITEMRVDMPTLVIVLGIAIIVLLVFVFWGSYFLDKITAQSIKTQTLEQYYQSLYEQNSDLIITFDLEGNFLSINRIGEFYGFKEEELQHQPFIPLIVPEHLKKTLEQFAMAKNGQRVNYDSAFYGKNGERFEVNISNFPIVVNNKIVGVYAVLKDITEFKKAQVILAEAKDQYKSLTENSVVGSYITQNGKFVYANQKLLELLGYNEGELVGSNPMDYVHPEDHPMILEKMKERINDLSSTVHYQYRMLKKDHTVIHVENFGSAMIYHGQPAAIGTIVDITARKKAEETIEYMAYHDSLTGLLNRNAFASHLKGYLSNESTDSLALLYIELDEFRLIDDALGHEIGDRLFKDVAERLKKCVPNQGELGRNRGDGLLVYLPNMGKAEASLVADQMLASCSDPFLFDQYELYVTPSIGISIYPYDAEIQEDLIKKAESAMHQAKKNGKNGYQSYNLNCLEQSHERLELEISLRKALERGEFLLYYQPKVDLTSGKVKGAEALIRWRHPIKGFISPGDFIPMAEEMGLIIPIGEWVLRTACMQLKEWQEEGLPFFEVSVNLSVRQLYRPHLVELVGGILEETGLDPKYLELEITESMLVDSDHGLNVLNELKALGLKISLDDFGTGFSSLHYLKEAPFDKLKIDQSFIRNCAVDSNSATIVRTIIAMAHQLNLEIIAEGVESAEHLIFLQQNLCDEAQGYLFSKPVSSEELVKCLPEMERIVHRYGIPKDLQNRKWMEKVLEIARQDLLDTIRQQQGMTFKFVEEEGKLIHTLCDGALLYRLGLIPEQIIGRELKDFLPAHDAEKKEEYYRRAWAGDKNVSYEAELNGVHYLASLRPIKRGGEVVEVIASCVDITERKQIEEALKMSDSNYRLIAENMIDLIEIWDVNGIITYSSPSHEKVLGHPYKSIEGTSVFSFVHPEDKQVIESLFSRLLLRNEASFKIEFRCKNASGVWVYVEAQGAPVLGENSEIELFVVVGRDISERKKQLGTKAWDAQYN